MSQSTSFHHEDRHARCIAASKRVRWTIEDLLGERSLDFGRKFLPDALTGVASAGLAPDDQRLVSQIQGRTYANMFGLVERYINAKVVDVQQQYVLGDQVALEALVRFSDEELKHQELFRRVEQMTVPGMPAGYSFAADPDEVAAAVLAHSPWSVLGLTHAIELVTQVHYRASIGPEPDLCPLFKDIFHHHWMEEAQHATLDEIEWQCEDRRLSHRERDQGVDDLIALVGAVDGILRSQATADAAYFMHASWRSHGGDSRTRIEQLFLDAYRWQYILSGVTLRRFQEVLGAMVSKRQLDRIQRALAGLAPQAGSAFAVRLT